MKSSRDAHNCSKRPTMYITFLRVEGFLLKASAALRFSGLHEISITISSSSIEQDFGCFIVWRSNTGRRSNLVELTDASPRAAAARITSVVSRSSSSRAPSFRLWYLETNLVSSLVIATKTCSKGRPLPSNRSGNLMVLRLNAQSQSFCCSTHSRSVVKLRGHLRDSIDMHWRANFCYHSDQVSFIRIELQECARISGHNLSHLEFICSCNSCAACSVIPYFCYIT